MEEVDSASGQLVLVNGPSRGGKSRWAEYLLSESGAVTYVATSARRPVYQGQRRSNQRSMPCSTGFQKCRNECTVTPQETYEYFPYNNSNS